MIAPLENSSVFCKNGADENTDFTQKRIDNFSACSGEQIFHRHKATKTQRKPSEVCAFVS
jgi:hypothetical protein